jgi:hypothetical protein
MARMTLRPSSPAAPPAENQTRSIVARDARRAIAGDADRRGTADRELESRPGERRRAPRRRTPVVAIVVEVTLSGALQAGQDAETAALGHLVTGLLRAGGLVFQPAGQGSTWQPVSPWAHVLRWEPPREG